MQTECRHCSEDKGHGVATAINPYSGRCELCGKQVRPDPRNDDMVDAMRYAFASPLCPRPKLTWWQKIIRGFKSICLLKRHC